ncbi:ABC transporter substrate-binding protein [Thermoanaerobacterium sp. RBIITD]|uniref:ABC transporter substrate-binding protein n=1 Tax=Thermoanaerobacterium sp. RBIITD TaxID=1550240 RepID=UPI000BB90B0E|nr:ABC transporter substrate-binding protein [Thermoanaerobacterium sp. RBIITD]SNX53068.1 branched-chain amino acid transport system substrate-binding protein [Thermoanaerobacterium sp. RBIITD]
MKKIYIATLVGLLSLSLIFTGCNKSSSNTINIGVNFELTGNQAAYGTSSMNGVNLAVEEANNNGGILGKKIQIIKADNKSDAGEATNATTKLVNQNKVVGIIGTSASTTSLGMVPVVTDAKIPMIATTATNPSVTVDPKTNKVRKYVFRACFIDPFQGKANADFAYNTLKAKNAVIYIDDKSDFSKGLAKVFEENFVKLGGKVLDKEAYVQGDNDFKATLTRLKGFNPDVIFLPGHYAEVGKIIKQAREMGINTPILGGDGWDSPDLVKIAGPSNMNNAYMSNHFIPSDNDPNVQNFVKKYKDKYGSLPDAKAVLAYDATNILFAAIKQANSTKSDDIVKALENLKNFTGVTGAIKFDNNHNPIKSAVIVEFKDGNQVFKAKVNP